MNRSAIAVNADLQLDSHVDPRAPGAAVTMELCGQYEHAGPCHWPHNNRIDNGSAHARLRTIVVLPEEDRGLVVGRIEQALRADPRWTVLNVETDGVAEDEQALAARLARNV